LHAIKDYRPPTLSGHKDGLVAVFFTGSRAVSAAELEGRPGPDLLTVSRDGALFTWRFEQDPAAARGAPASQATLADGQDGADEDGAAAASRPDKRRKTDAQRCKNYAG
jgi:hypothetical protein